MKGKIMCKEYTLIIYTNDGKTYETKKIKNYLYTNDENAKITENILLDTANNLSVLKNKIIEYNLLNWVDFKEGFNKSKSITLHYYLFDYIKIKEKDIANILLIEEIRNDDKFKTINELKDILHYNDFIAFVNNNMKGVNLIL